MENNQELLCFGHYNRWRIAVEKAKGSVGYDRFWYCQVAKFQQAQYVMAHALEGKHANH